MTRGTVRLASASVVLALLAATGAGCVVDTRPRAVYYVTPRPRHYRTVYVAPARPVYVAPVAAPPVVYVR